MSIYKNYLEQIAQRKLQGLHPQPIDGAELLSEIISQIKDVDHTYRKDSLDFFIYNVLPGTTSAAVVKAKFLKEIIIGESIVKEISSSFATSAIIAMPSTMLAVSSALLRLISTAIIFLAPSA